MRTLEERLLETKGQLAQAVSQNEKLTYTLREAREHIAALRDEVDKLTQPPSAYGTFLERNDDGTVDVFAERPQDAGRPPPEIETEDLQRGQEVVLNESLNVVLARSTDNTGELVTLKELLDDGKRAVIVGRADEERVVEMVDELQGRPCGRAPASCSIPGPTCCSRSCPDPRSRSSSSRRSPTSPTKTSAASIPRSNRSPMPSSCRSCTRTCSPNTTCRPRRASCSTARPAAARP